MERWGAEEADGAPSWLSSPARAERGSEGKVEGYALGLGIEERENEGIGRRELLSLARCGVW